MKDIVLLLLIVFLCGVSYEAGGASYRWLTRRIPCPHKLRAKRKDEAWRYCKICNELY